MRALFRLLQLCVVTAVITAVALVLVSLGAGCSDDAAPATGGASERDLCESTGQCIFGAGEDGDAFADLCVDDDVFADAPPGCLDCLVELNCKTLEAVFDGDAAAEAMCKACE